jgi:hypothetical protein
MPSRPQHQNLLYSLSCLSFAVVLNLLANGCSQQAKPISPASTGNENHRPYTFYAPSPADGAAEIGDKVTFEWQFDNPDNIPMHYEIYMGTDSLIYISDATTATSYTPPWGMQSRAKEMLVQIYEMQRAYRTYFNSYAGSGLCASAAAPQQLILTLGLTIDPQDRYNYTIEIATPLNMHCSASGQLDYSNPEYDMWTINQNGLIQHTLFELPLEFQPSTEYFWQVVAVDSGQNRIESPIWHFTTTPNVIYPSNNPIVPCLPYPEFSNNQASLFNCFCWYAGSPADSLTFDLFLGLGDNLQLHKSGIRDGIYFPDWRHQKNVTNTLTRIFDVEQNLKKENGCYRGNGSVRLAGGWGGFDSTCLQNAWIFNEDVYDYYVFADSNIFSVVAVSTVNFDDDPDIDSWTIDQSGTLQCVTNDSDIPYSPSNRYSWKIVAHDSHGNIIEGPVWQFISNRFRDWYQ